MMERHGIADAKRKMVIGDELSSVSITDNRAGILLYVQHEHALLDPDQARYIARKLIEAVNRYDKREPK